MKRQMQAVSRRALLTARRGVLRLIEDGGDNELPRAQVEGFAGDLSARVERWEPYGFATSPAAGADALLLSLGGDTNHTVLIAVHDRRYRLSVAGGEVALYDDQGQVIHLKRDGILIDAGGDRNVTIRGKAVTIEAETVAVTADTTIDLTAGAVIDLESGAHVSAGTAGSKANYPGTGTNVNWKNGV